MLGPLEALRELSWGQSRPDERCVGAHARTGIEIVCLSICSVLDVAGIRTLSPDQ